MNIPFVFNFYLHLFGNPSGYAGRTFSQGPDHFVVQFRPFQQLFQVNAVTNGFRSLLQEVFIDGRRGFNHNLFNPLNFACNLCFALLKCLQGIVFYQAQVMPQLRQSQIRIIFPQHEPVLRPAGKHPVGFTGAPGDKIIDHDTHISLGSIQDKLRSPLYFAGRIYAGPQALGGRFFIPGGTVDLSGQKKSRDPFGFQGGFKFNGVDIVVFNGIGRSHDVGRLETFHRADQLYLNLQGKTVAQPAGIDFLGIHAFGLKDDLVPIAVRKFNNFILKRWAIACRCSRYDAAVKG